MTKAEIGLLPRYHITKVNGNPMDPDADYFVLRLDSKGDPAHVMASKLALIQYANSIRDTLPKLADDLFEKYNLLEVSLEHMDQALVYADRILKLISPSDPVSEFKNNGDRTKMFEAIERHVATSKRQADSIVGDRSEHLFDRT